MKRTLVFVLIMVFCLTFGSNAVFADSGTTVGGIEGAKIIMGGNTANFKDVPITVDGKTFLPLREMLTDLGVPNDDGHIIWEGKDKSITIKKDTGVIRLKIGSCTIYVDDTAFELDSAPMIYAGNGRAYVPLSFLPDAFDKKAVWSDAGRAVLVRDTAEYGRIKEILDRSNASMKEVSKCRMNMDMTTYSGNDSFNSSMKFSVSSEMDTAGKAMHMNMLVDLLGMNMNVEAYYYDNTVYMKNPLTDSWEKTTYEPEEYARLFGEQSLTELLDENETLCAGLDISESQNANEILLTGDVYLPDFSGSLDSSDFATGSLVDADAGKYHTEISIDKTTNLINSLSIKLNTSSAQDNLKVSSEVAINIAYSDYNGNFEISVPADVLENAVESDGSMSLF